MKPEYVGVGNFDTNNYVYAYCKCPLSTDYAIKWPRIKDGIPHSYTCTCEDCGTTVSVISKSYGPEVYKEMEMKAIKTAADTEQQPCANKSSSNIQNKLIGAEVLDKMRDEFISLYPKNYAGEPELGGVSCVFSLNKVLNIIDKYKESLTEAEGSEDIKNA